MRKFFPLCAVLITVFALSIATAAELPKLETKVKTIAVFKNGLGFVFRTGKTSLTEGWADMAELPPAALGTMWIGTTNPLERVDEVVAYKGTSEGERDPQTLAEIVDLNVGNTLGITYTAGSGEPKYVRGKVVMSAGQIVLIESIPNTGTGTVALKKDSIQSIDALSNDSKLKARDTASTNKAKVHVGGKAGSAEVTLAYLEKGMTWSPSYLVNIRDEKTADITLEAVLANDVEDLEDADVSFVVGYPNFQFSDITTPLSLQQSVSQFISAVTSGGRAGGSYGGITSQIMSNSIAVNGAYNWDSNGWRPEDNYSTAKPMAGESNEDLYLYQQQHVTLKKGDRARYTVFTGRAPYEHVYELDVPDSMNVDYYGNRSGDAKPDDPQVWHVLRLENTTEHPWTTAPALAVNGSMPVAQDTIRYTPPGGKSTLKLTVATDVSAHQEQTEASREPTTILDRRYDIVTVKGKLTLRSYKPQPIKISIKKSMVGEVLEASDQGKATKLAMRLNSVNPDSQIAWDFELKPGVDKVLTYQYKVLIYR